MSAESPRPFEQHGNLGSSSIPSESFEKGTLPEQTAQLPSAPTRREIKPLIRYFMAKTLQGIRR